VASWPSASPARVPGQLGRETRGFVDGRNPSPQRDFLPCA